MSDAQVMVTNKVILTRSPAVLKGCRSNAELRADVDETGLVPYLFVMKNKHSVQEAIVYIG